MQTVFAIDDLKRVRKLVEQAAREELMGRFEQVSADHKADGSLITEADLSMQHRLQRELAAGWPRFGLLGEEMPADEQRALLAAPGRGLWCLDPLDGTSNFAAGIPFFAVSLALMVDGRPLAGIVHDPVRGESFQALAGQGAWLNDRPLVAPAAPARLADAMAMVDLKRLPPPLIGALARHAPYRSQRSFGSVALDWCWIACGRCHLYLHGGQKLWDYAAGRLVLAESGAAGGLLERFDGDWVEQPSLEPRIAVAAAGPELLADWRSWIAARHAGGLES